MDIQSTCVPPSSTTSSGGRVPHRHRGPPAPPRTRVPAGHSRRWHDGVHNRNRICCHRQKNYTFGRSGAHIQRTTRKAGAYAGHRGRIGLPVARAHLALVHATPGTSSTNWTRRLERAGRTTKPTTCSARPLNHDTRTRPGDRERPQLERRPYPVDRRPEVDSFNSMGKKPTATEPRR